ncbi:hypothetical protein K7X08_021443 [Anisodus acutangulus]|uniref:Uncharacterized protein n=1 Tax=Anisodus acutangulus TaxID=402998 RepID=A0A9Q1M7M6_9SOLA|nr:hypothetical protein K7X08_021443 [Anisodus acutangulus]
MVAQNKKSAGLPIGSPGRNKCSTYISLDISIEAQVEGSDKAKALQTNEMQLASVEDEPTMHISNPEIAKALKKDRVPRMINSSPVINPLSL